MLEDPEAGAGCRVGRAWMKPWGEDWYSQVGRGRPARRAREAEAGGVSEPQIRSRTGGSVIQEQGVVLASSIPCEIEEGVRKTSSSPGGPLHPLKDLESRNETRGPWVSFPRSLQVRPWAWGTQPCSSMKAGPASWAACSPSRFPPEASGLGACGSVAQAWGGGWGEPPHR